MRYKKALICILAVLLLAACTAEKETDKEKEPEKASKQISETSRAQDQTKIVNNFEISFLSAEKLDSTEGAVLQLNFSVKNKNADMRSFDSFFFVANNKEGDRLEIAPKENFANELNPGETQEGSIYYYLEGSAPITVNYEDLDSDETETWIIEEIVE